jgi:hypothetical protein
MKKATIIAAIVTPLVAAGAGFMLARATNANAVDASGYCVEPTVYVDIANGVSMVTGGPDSSAECNGASCIVAGPEQVQINADGHVQCVGVSEGESLLLTRWGSGVSASVERVAAR